MYTLTLTRSRLGLLSIHFRKFATELQPLIDVRISFPLNIMTMNGHNLTKFCIHIIIDKVFLGIVKRHFCKFATELRPLIDARISFPLNILRRNGQNLTKLCIYISIEKILFGIVNRHFFDKFVSEL